MVQPPTTRNSTSRKRFDVLWLLYGWGLVVLGSGVCERLRDTGASRNSVLGFLGLRYGALCAAGPLPLDQGELQLSRF